MLICVHNTQSAWLMSSAHFWLLQPSSIELRGFFDDRGQPRSPPLMCEKKKVGNTHVPFSHPTTQKSVLMIRMSVPARSTAIPGTSHLKLGSPFLGRATTEKLLRFIHENQATSFM